jgi:hypothetical protein
MACQGERGTVTAELALTLPALVIALTAVLAVGQVVVVKVQCLDGARAAARMAARGEGDQKVVGAGRSAGPPGARVLLDRGGAEVAVQVSAPVRLALPGGPSVQISATARADAEQTSGPPL